VGQLLANQGQEWMGIRATSKKLVLQVSKIKGDKRPGVGLERISSDVQVL
jgi:hypothetical protein